MISTSLLFIFLAGIAFLGFIISIFSSKIRITKTMPLMIIGLIAGPVLGAVATGPTSTISKLSPIITSIAIAFILFDVGINMDLSKLSKVIKLSTAFTLMLAISTGIVLGVIAYLTFHWTLIESLIFGFALSGPSSIIVPTLMKSISAKSEMKTALVYESVASDSVELIIPILLLKVMLSANPTITLVAMMVFDAIAGSIIFGTALALLWLYLLKRFGSLGRNYGWTLTITMVIATYGLAQQFGFNGAFTIFVFSLAFANIGNLSTKIYRLTANPRSKTSIPEEIMSKYFSFPDVSYIKNYHKEIEFFTSTFFFVYIGLLFTISGISTTLIAVSVIATVIIIALRYLFFPILKKFASSDVNEFNATRAMVAFDIPRGLSPAIVATLPLALGIIIPNFLNQIFMVIFVTNLISTIGMFLVYRKKRINPAILVQT
ncbi:MAG: cation:proton antiporter [Candidatus Marsarchaeota archaeon]|nr:cation:proton antiporter [Candidatus Marsarchaeota archaeon]MCL5413525.1 cation:proton antiporter [Candidatus Marsarchaeota archaeon]